MNIIQLIVTGNVLDVDRGEIGVFSTTLSC